MALTKWATVAGVPVHYARHLTPSLRNPGKPITSWRSTPGFKAKIDAMFEELWAVCPLGAADIIVSAGAFVDRNVAGSAKKSAHASGRAFDIDGLVWRATSDRPEIALYAVDHAVQPRFYWAVCAVLNRHLRHVLHAAYNRPHHDHFHVEDTHPPAFRHDSRALVTFLQSALTHVHGVPVAVDGALGTQTETAADQVLRRLGLQGSLNDTETWLAFNLETARIGMSALAAHGSDDPDRDDDPEPEVAGTPEGSHERPLDVPTLRRRLRLTRPRLRGDDVREVQRLLRVAGLGPGDVDGVFGPLTRAATVAFQAMSGLEPDGIVGPITLAALARATADAA